MTVTKEDRGTATARNLRGQGRQRRTGRSDAAPGRGRPTPAFPKALRMAELYADELARTEGRHVMTADRPTQTKLVLALLQAAGDQGVSALTLLKVAGVYRAGARIYELRQAGHQIRTERKARQTARYYLEVAA